MPLFKFNTVSRSDIERSKGGNVMIYAIDFDGGKNQLIVGIPGSGKTTVTLMRAERLINQGKKIKVFTFQTLLRLSLHNIASDTLKDHIFSFYRWYYDKYGWLYPSDTEVEMLEKMQAEPDYDEILIDEGQDFEERIYKSLIPKCDKMTVGADDAQKIHDDGITAGEIETELESHNSTSLVRLEYNYRNTFEIYNFARYFMPDSERANNPITLEKMPRGNGSIPIIIQSTSEAETFERIKIILRDNGGRNVAILLYHRSEVETYYAKIRAMGFSCSRYHGKWHEGPEIENILITTYKSAKGLEFQVVIMPDMQTAMDSSEKTSEHYYIGCTRAKETLFLIFKGSSIPKCFTNFSTDSYTFLPHNNGTKPIDDLPF